MHLYKYGFLIEIYFLQAGWDYLLKYHSTYKFREKHFKHRRRGITLKEQSKRVKVFFGLPRPRPPYETSHQAAIDFAVRLPYDYLADWVIILEYILISYVNLF